MTTRLTSAEAQARALQSAREVVAEFGMSGFTIDAVSERSGVAKTTIYRRWASIEELKIDAVTSFVAELPVPDTGDLEADLVAVLQLLLTAATEGPLRPLMLSVLDAALHDERLTKLRQDLMSTTADPVTAVLRTWVERGALPADLSIELAADLVRGPVFVRTIVDGRTMSAPDLIVMVRAIMHVLQAMEPNSNPVGVEKLQA